MADLTSCVHLVGMHRLRKAIREDAIPSTLTHAQRTAIWVSEAVIEAGMSTEELARLVEVLQAEVASRVSMETQGPAPRCA